MLKYKNNRYNITLDEKMYKDLVEEYHHRRRIYRKRQIASRILWCFAAPIILAMVPFFFTIIFVDFTEIEETIISAVMLFGCVCGLLAYRIDPEYEKLPSLEDALYEDDEEEE